MELCLLNLLILIDCFLCNSYPCVLFESLSHVINQESHVYSWNLGKIYLVHFLKFWNLPCFTREIQKFQKSELGKFIPNFPLKHVITSTNQKGFLPSPIYKHLKGIFQTWPFSANRQNSTVFSVTSDYHEFVWYIFPCQNYVFIPLFYSSALKVPNKVNFKVLAPT